MSSKKILLVGCSYITPPPKISAQKVSLEFRSFSLQNLKGYLNNRSQLLALAKRWLPLADQIMLWADLVICMDHESLAFLRHFPENMGGLVIETSELHNIYQDSSTGLFTEAHIDSFSIPLVSGVSRSPVSCLLMPHATSQALVNPELASKFHNISPSGPPPVKLYSVSEDLWSNAKVYPQGRVSSSLATLEEAERPFLVRRVGLTNSGNMIITGRDPQTGKLVKSFRDPSLLSFFVCLLQNFTEAELYCSFANLADVSSLKPGSFKLFRFPTAKSGNPPNGSKIYRMSPKIGASAEAISNLTRQLRFKANQGKLLQLNSDLSPCANYQLQTSCMFNNLVAVKGSLTEQITLLPSDRFHRFAILLECSPRFINPVSQKSLFPGPGAGYLLMLGPQGSVEHLDKEPPTPELIAKLHLDFILYQGTESLSFYLAFLHRELELSCGLINLRDCEILLENLADKTVDQLGYVEAGKLLMETVEKRGFVQQLMTSMELVGCTSFAEADHSNMKRNRSAYARALRDVTQKDKLVLFPSLPVIKGDDPERVSHEGGYTHVPQPTHKRKNGHDIPCGYLYRGVTEFDLKSNYVYRIIHHNISPEGEGVIPTFLKKLLTARQDAKQKGLMATQEAYKLMANTFFGWISRLFPELGGEITRGGQALIKEAITLVSIRAKFEVVFGVTDSIFVMCPEEREEEVLEVLNSTLGSKFTAIFEKKVRYAIFAKFPQEQSYAGLIRDGDQALLRLASKTMTFTAAPVPDRIKESCSLAMFRLLENELTGEKNQASSPPVSKILENAGRPKQPFEFATVNTFNLPDFIGRLLSLDKAQQSTTYELKKILLRTSLCHAEFPLEASQLKTIRVTPPFGVPHRILMSDDPAHDHLEIDPAVYQTHLNTAIKQLISTFREIEHYTPTKVNPPPTKKPAKPTKSAKELQRFADQLLAR